MKVYAIEYTNTEGFDYAYEVYGYYSSKKKAEKIMNKIQRIKALAEELGRNFDDHNLWSLINCSQSFHITKIRIQ